MPVGCLSSFIQFAALVIMLLLTPGITNADTGGNPPLAIRHDMHPPMQIDSGLLPANIPVMQNMQARVGKPAPLFTLDAMVGKTPGEEFRKVSLADYRGKWVVLFFYPNDFTFVCPTEIRGFNAALDTFRKLNAEILGASVDSKFAHLAWLKRGDLGDLSYPLLADVRKEITHAYGILDPQEGVAQRGLFIIDPAGVLQYQLVHNNSVGRSVEETLRVLEALQTGELCPIGWKPGENTLGK